MHRQSIRGTNMLLDKLPLIQYDYSRPEDKENMTFSVSDIFSRVQRFSNTATEDLLFVDYYVDDAETPEAISLKLYDTPLHNWTILYVNNITDMVNQWPRGTDEINEYLTSFYDDDVPDERAFHTVEGYTKNDGSFESTKSYFYLKKQPTAAEINQFNELKVGDYIFHTTFIDNDEVCRISSIDYNSKVAELDIVLLTPSFTYINKFDDQIFEDDPHTFIFKRGVKKAYSTAYHKSAKTGVLSDIDFFNRYFITNSQGNVVTNYNSYPSNGQIINTIITKNDSVVYVTYADIILEENEARRHIKVVSPKYIDLFVQKYYSALI